MGTLIRKTTLVIYRDHSQCSACGGRADMSEKHHDTLKGPGADGQKGCELPFVQVAAGNTFPYAQVVQALRPDLTFVGFGDVEIRNNESVFVQSKTPEEARGI